VSVLRHDGAVKSRSTHWGVQRPLVIIQPVIPFVPMLLASSREWLAGAGWALEPKWDGYRLIAHIAGGRARCWTRTVPT
jgi:ATP-dependent DNA ligase